MPSSGAVRGQCLLDESRSGCGNGYLSSSGASIIRVPNCRAKITISGEKRIIKRVRQHN